MFVFKQNVQGKMVCNDGANVKHCGKDGHWLERKMGVTHNADNKPDILGFEMKNQTRGKTTFGDWSANYYIYKDPKFELDRDAFLKTFGKPNLNKGGRCSWSGEPCPKIGDSNRFGQKLEVDVDCNILASYSFTSDARVDKFDIVNEQLQKENLLLARWDAKKIAKRVEDKFNQLGWFKCMKDENNLYSEIVFGGPISYDNWIQKVREGVVFFDSGMYEGNARNYSQWRANNNFWDSLVCERYC